jgi:putative YhbY family RNA-binding protein
MTELTLTRDQRLALRARAHHLDPVVLLGAAGLTEAVLKETDRALTAHELIKVRIPGDDRDDREAVCVQLAERLGAARVQVIGKLLVLFRPRPEEDDKPARPAAKPRPAQRGGPAAGSRQVPPTARPAAPSPRTAQRRGSTRGR